ncbi:hypothetical protein O3M35_001132 [Rhynocoris fuscipes]|uniref:Tetraspanin n=1 Tax=Rhynocoris fuscipes TaxID=488301 RepID=A0AAW1DQ74_9HEMI
MRGPATWFISNSNPNGVSLLVLATQSISEIGFYIATAHNEHYVYIVLFVLVSVIFITSLMGCVGAWTGRFQILLFYWIIMCLTSLVSFLAGVIALVGRIIIELVMRNSLKALFQKHNMNVINKLQEYFQCCGLNGTSYYSFEKELPASCCPTSVCDISHSYNRGCLIVIIEEMKKIFLTLGVSFIIVGILICIVGSFAFYLGALIREEKKEKLNIIK